MRNEAFMASSETPSLLPHGSTCPGPRTMPECRVALFPEDSRL